MILTIILASWIVALVLVGGLCVSAGRGDAALHGQLLEPSHEQTGADGGEQTAAAGGERRPTATARRQPEQERARVGRVALG